MRALVTGATGMLGRHIAERLVADGWQVRAMVRDPVAARALSDAGIALVEGNVLDRDAFVRAAAGCEVVFHAAAEIITPGGWERYRTVNVDGTRHAIDAAASAGARLMHVSSVAVYGAEARYLAMRNGGRTDEDTPLLPLHERAYYARSKRESEALVLDAHRAGRIWATAIRPDVIYGPHDRQFVPRVARAMRLRVVPLVAGGRSTLAVVHAANVADGAVRAATSDVAAGRAWNLANDFDVTVREFFTYAAQGLGHGVAQVPVPLPVARGLLRGLRAVLRAFTGGRFNLIGPGSLDFVTHDNPFTSDRARRDLGWSPSVQPAQGVREAFAWWAAHRTA